MSNNNYIERHKRILNIVSHLGLNKKKSTIPVFEKKRLSQSRIVFYKPEQHQEEEDQLIVKAKELLSKPLKRKHIRSESQLVELISDKYNMLKDDVEENSAYHHIQLSLLKLQEQEILGQTHEVKHNLRMSKTTYPAPIKLPQPKLNIQNMFEKKCSQHIVESPKNNTIRQKINDFLYKTRESFLDFQADVSHYKILNSIIDYINKEPRYISNNDFQFLIFQINFYIIFLHPISLFPNKLQINYNEINFRQYIQVIQSIIQRYLKLFFKVQSKSIIKILLIFIIQQFFNYFQIKKILL